MHLAGLHRHTLLQTVTDILGNSEFLSPQNRTELSVFAGENVLRAQKILFQALLPRSPPLRRQYPRNADTFMSIVFLLFVRALKLPQCSVLRNV